MPRAVARLAQSNPTLRISLHDASSPALIERMRDGLLDLAVVAIGPDLPDYDLSDLRRDVLLSEALRVASPPHTRSRGARRSRSPTCATNRGSSARPLPPPSQSSPPGPRSRNPDRLREPEWPTRLGMVAAGLGIALIPGLAAESVPAASPWSMSTMSTHRAHRGRDHAGGPIGRSRGSGRGAALGSRPHRAHPPATVARRFDVGDFGDMMRRSMT